MDGIAGQTFGRYRLLSLIGKGGMGEIYLAVGPGVAGVEKRLAIKKLLPLLAEDPGFVARFLDEARLVVSLSHGNIVPVFEAGQVGRDYFLAMEYVDGWNLRDVSEAAKKAGLQIPLPLALYMAQEVSRGLGHAHRKADADGKLLGIIHRDVSPHNVLVSRDGDVKIVDFGIAKAAGKTQRTHTGSLLGKFAYMSPEQAMGLPLDPRSDLFSLGVVLYELITGAPLFDGETDPEVLRRVQEAAVPPPSSVRADVTPALDALLLRCLARDPGARVASMEELTKEIGRLLFTDGGATAADMARFLSRLFPTRPRHADLPLPTFEMLPPPRDATASMVSPADEAPPPPATPARTWTRAVPLALAVGAVGVAAGFYLRAPPVAPEVTLAAPTDAKPLEAAHPSAAPSSPAAMVLPPQALLPATSTPSPGPVLTAAANPTPDLRPPAPSANPVQPPVEPPKTHAERIRARANAAPHAAGSPAARADSAPSSAASGPPGFLSLRVDPWGEIWIDGDKVAETSALVRHPLSPGTHKLVVKNGPLGKEQSLPVDISSGATLIRHVSF